MVSKKTKEAIFTACVIVCSGTFGAVALDSGLTVMEAGIAVFLFLAALKTTHDYCNNGG